MEIVALVVVLAAGWFWSDSMRAREVAIDAGRRACDAEQVQFLDWSVALRKIRLSRDDEGRRRLQRTYEFEFSDTGNNRLRGSVTLIGRQLLALNLPTSVANPGELTRLH
ncbi:MAG: DUF3301 domain-containing protein [Burkholderiales bacterium]